MPNIAYSCLKLTKGGTNILRKQQIFELSVAVLLENSTINRGTHRMLRLMDGSVTAVGTVAANLPGTVKDNATAGEH